MILKKRVAWNKGKHGIYSSETLERWSKIRKGRKPTKIQVELMLASRKITNQKKAKELFNRKCYNDPSHKPFTNKSSGNPSWFKHPDIKGEFLCGNCNYHAKKNLRYSSIEERKKAQSKFMKEKNPMFQLDARKKISIKQSGKNNSFFGKKHSKEFIEDIRLRWTGEGNPNYGGLSPERKKALSKIKLEMYASGKLKPSVQKKGPDSPLYGKKRPPQVALAASIANTGKIVKESTKVKLRAKRALQTNFGQRGGENTHELLLAYLLDELAIPYDKK